MTAPCLHGNVCAAAEELYGGQGIDAVSLREIQRASGVKNATALQYHFGDRAGLLTAVLEKHSYDVELRGMHCWIATRRPVTRTYARSPKHCSTAGVETGRYPAAALIYASMPT